MLDEIQPILKPDDNPGTMPHLRGKIIIAGPCSVESRSQIIDTAGELASTVRPHILRAGIWKPRTQPGCFEGLGEKALPWLVEAAEKAGVPAATEVGTAEHTRLALKAGIKMLWIGARTSVNPFAVQEIAETIAAEAPDASVLVKNPVNPDIELWIGALKRLYDCGLRRLGAVHRGFSVYDSAPYRNRPIWQIPLELHRRIPGIQIFHDPSHTGGKASFLQPLSQSALDRGFDGLMIESHIEPDKALSDGGQQITPRQLKELLDKLTVSRVAADSDFLNEMRGKIDECDEELLSVLARRMDLCRSVGDYKRKEGLQIVQPERYRRLLSTLADRGSELGLSPEFVKDIIELVHDESVRIQIERRQ